METTVPTVSRKKLILLWGAIAGGAAVALSYIFKLIGMQSGGGGLLMTAIIAVGVGFCMAKAVKTHRDKNNNGYIPFGKAFSMAFVTGLWAAVITTVLSFAIIQIVGTDDYFKDIEEEQMEAIAKMEEDGASEEQIEMTEKFMSYAKNIPLILGMGFIINIIGSLIIGLIVAAIVKKEGAENTFAG